MESRKTWPSSHVQTAGTKLLVITISPTDALGVYQPLEWNADAERDQPYIKGFNVWGKRYDDGRLIARKIGVVSLGYEPTYGTNYHLYSASSVLYSCPVSMSNGATLILGQECRRLSADRPFQTVYQKLVSTGEDYWTSGQWTTKRTGGSNVQNTETWATYSPLPHKSKASNSLDEGDYLISGFRFFSSATDTDVDSLLAKTSSGKLSTFLAPLRSAVVGKTDRRAHLIRNSVTATAPLLNVTRTHTFIGWRAAWWRSTSIAKSFAKAWTTVGEPLWLIPMHLSLIADLEVKHLGAMNLAFFTVAVMGVVENNGVSTPAVHLSTKGKEARVVFRALPATTTKTVVILLRSKSSTAGIQECQEAIGGGGYCMYMDEPDEPEFNVARLLCNTYVNPIWDGTTNMLASELARFLVKGDNLAIFSCWFDRTLKLCGVLLTLDAEQDGDGIASEIARR
ncbi:hypothetical protein BDV28DRAFT_157021 [Aspergillus coremiiformis]|uniref:Uncharacterized protein n=1 Tax=Aspergillus coremiiformis TaxID=138285 RepID=A0A5N6Z7S7_9EURO|nr:hypothetical protein BDV28DRAFT_157021 [Aspergillus coremiiformis]